MRTIQDDFGAEVNNGFEYGQLGHSRFEIGGQQLRYQIDCFCLYTLLLNLCKYAWLKTKEAFRKYSNEYRISIFVLAIILFACFCILIRLSQPAGEGPRAILLENKG